MRSSRWDSGWRQCWRLERGLWGHKRGPCRGQTARWAPHQAGVAQGVADLKLEHRDAGGAAGGVSGGSGLRGSGGQGCGLGARRPSPSGCRGTGIGAPKVTRFGGRDRGPSLPLQVPPNKHTKPIHFLLPFLFRASSCSRWFRGVSTHQVRGDPLPGRGTDPYGSLTSRKGPLAPGHRAHSTPPQGKARDNTGCSRRPTSGRGIRKVPKLTPPPEALHSAEGPYLHPRLPTLPRPRPRG